MYDDAALRVRCFWIMILLGNGHIVYIQTVYVCRNKDERGLNGYVIGWVSELEDCYTVCKQIVCMYDRDERCMNG